MLTSPQDPAERARALTALLPQLVSFTTDQGTEGGLANAVLPTLSEGLPAWMRGSFPEPPEEAGIEAHVFQRALIIPGGLHVLHNLAWQADAELSHFQLWLPQLQSVVTLLHYRHHRERFLQSCIRGTAWEGTASARVLEKGGIATTVEWRWNSLIDILQDLLPLEGLLRSTFVAERMHCVNTEDQDASLVVAEPDTLGGDDASEAHQGRRQRVGRLDITFVSSSIHDALFWNYARVLGKLHQALLDFSGWLESCPCHEAQWRFGKDEWALLKDIRSELNLTNLACDELGFVCPLASLRSPELAAQEWRDVLAALADTRWQELLCEAVLPKPDDLALLLEVFETGRLQVFATLEMKLLPWSTLPWRLAGVGHHRQEVARRVAQEILVEWGAMSQDPAQHHSLTLHFLSPQSVLLPQLERFASGEVDLFDAPELATEVSRLRFIPLTERKVCSLASGA